MPYSVYTGSFSPDGKEAGERS